MRILTVCNVAIAILNPNITPEEVYLAKFDDKERAEKCGYYYPKQDDVKCLTCCGNCTEFFVVEEA